MSDREQPESVSNKENELASSDSDRLSLRSKILNLRPESILPTFLQNRLGRFSQFGGAALILLILGGIGYGATTLDHQLNEPKRHFAAKVSPFSILSTSPTQDEQDLHKVEKIVINFNKPVDPSKLKGDFWITPATDGTFTQTSSNQAIFTPVAPLAPGTTYEVMVHAEFTSKSGTPLGSDYNFNFTTATPDTSVIFQSGNERPAFASSQVGLDQVYSLSVGADIDPNSEINVYKATQDDLVNALQEDANGGGSTSYDGLTVSNQIETSNWPIVQTQKGISDGNTLTLNLPKGTYLIAAMSNDIQVGATWLNVTDLGVALRQDDQKIVFAVSSLSTSTPVKADVQILVADSIADPQEQTIDGIGSMDAPYKNSGNPSWAIVKTADDFAFVPINTIYSLADLRVNQNLSTSTQSFGLTDKPTYTVGEYVKFSGFVYTDNDVHFKPIANRSVKVYVSSDKWGDSLTSTTLTSDANGEISGKFVVDPSWLSGTTDDGSGPKDITYDSANFGIYVSDNSSELDFLAGSQIATFTVVNSSLATNDVTVKFSKSAYVATDPISAQISVRDSKGEPLANKHISVDIFAQQFDETKSETPRILSDSPGEEILQQPEDITLDANGQANVPVDVSLIPTGSSQVITLQAKTDKDSNGNVGAGGASVVVHQGAGEIQFGPSQGVVAPGGTVTSRVYVKTLGGFPIPNATVSYSLTGFTQDVTGNQTLNKLGSGTVKADASGYAQISQSIGSFGASKFDDDAVTLQVSAGDANNDVIENSESYYIEDPASTVSHSDLQLFGLDISGSSTNVVVGQTLNLTVTAPADIHALVAIDRGRIYKYETVDLKKGDNTYTVVVTPDMLPSFNLSFSYFLNGDYKVEGQAFYVSPAPKITTISITPDHKNYSAGDAAKIQFKATDLNGNPMQTNLIIGVVNEKMYRLNAQPVPEPASLYLPRDLTINSSSSLTGIGSGGPGGCGGGGNGYDGSDSLLNPIGSSIYWSPSTVTGTDGTTNIQVKLPKGTWRVFVYSIDQAVDVGSSYIDVTAN